jgi:hypothetical protein
VEALKGYKKGQDDETKNANSSKAFSAESHEPDNRQNSVFGSTQILPISKTRNSHT